MKRILITGALGQIGSELTLSLRETYGKDKVIATDIRKPDHEVATEGPFEILDVMDQKRMSQLVSTHRVDTIIHLAALLSAKAELNPLFAWNLNMSGLLNVLETAKEFKTKFFAPSSIGAFGPTTPKNATPQNTIQRPTTMYGINKLTGELLADYYFRRYGVDCRGLRFPGLISYKTQPGGGTTDYAVKMYHEAVKHRRYTSYIKKGTYLDMMYMPDALAAIIQLMEADGTQLKNRNAYNVTAMSLDPEKLAQSIRREIPEFRLDYKIDSVRQQIADSWPNQLDASCAKEEWGFKPTFTLDRMTKEMIKNIM